MFYDDYYLSGKTYRRIQAAYENPDINVFIFEFLDERMILEVQRELFKDTDIHDLKLKGKTKATNQKI